MARTQYTFTFTNAAPGAPVTFSAAVFASKTAQVAEGPTLALDSTRTVAVWSDATELTATWVDGAGTSVAAEASVAIPVVKQTVGTPGAGPEPADTAETTRATTAEGLKLAKASNLSDVADPVAARANLGAAQLLTRGAVKTGNYTATAGELVPCDTTSAAFTITLPTAPAVGTRIAVKIVTLGAGHFVTIACGGSDVFNKTGGATTASLQLLGHAMNLQYDAGAIWTVVADDVPLSQLNGSFLSIAAGAGLTQGAPLASPVFTGEMKLAGGNGSNGTLFDVKYRTLNGDDNAFLVLGTGQDVTDQVSQTYMATISPQGVNTTGAGAGAIGFNIGQWIVTATDGASALTRTTEWANIEHDYIQFQQTGGTAVFNRVVSSRFRFAIPKTGVTIVDNKGIDFVLPNLSDVTGAVTNYIAINIPSLTGAGGTNFYGIRLNNEPSAGSIAAAAGHISLRTIQAAKSVYIADQTSQVGAVGSLQFLPHPGGSVSSRIAFGTSGGGFMLAWAANNAGTITDLMTLTDGGNLAITGTIAATGGWSGAFSSTSTISSTVGFTVSASGRPKTLAIAQASPADILQITSNGNTGGWHGCIDLMVSNSAGTAFTVLRIDGAGTATGAVGFFGHAVSGQRATTADATDLASVITLANALKADLQAYGLKA